MEEAFTKKELNKLEDLVAEKTSASDFEYQDDDYREFMDKLQEKLIRLFNSSR